MNKTKKIIGRTIKSIVLIVMIMSSVTPAHARIIFTDDVLENNSESFQIGSDDDAATTALSLEFGGTNSVSLSWDTTAFNLSDALTVDGNISQNGTTFTLDADNTGPGNTIEIVAEQGSDNNGTLRYNATNNLWEFSNDGGAFQAIGTGTGGSGDLDDAYDNDTDKILNVDNSGGLEIESTVTGNIVIDLQSTGDFVVEDAGTIFATFTDTGEFLIDNLQMDSNRLSSTNLNGNITLDPDGNGFINLDSNVNIAGENLVLDSDNSGNDIKLQFGQILNESLKWESSSNRFAFSDDLRVEEGLEVLGSLVIGDSALDLATFNARLNSDLIPSADLTYNLGSESLRWKNVFVDDITITGTLQVNEGIAIELNNNSGGTLFLGDVLVLDENFPNSAKRTNQKKDSKRIGVANETALNGDPISVIIGGTVVSVTCIGPVSIGDKLVTSTTPGACESLSGQTGGVTFAIATSSKGPGVGNVEALINLE